MQVSVVNILSKVLFVVSTVLLVRITALWMGVLCITSLSKKKKSSLIEQVTSCTILLQPYGTVMKKSSHSKIQ